MHKSRHIIFLLGLTALLFSCRPELEAFSGKPHFWRPTSTGKTLFDWPSGDTTVYVCTVCYPDGYDWLTDSASLKEGCRIRLLANGRTLLEQETGAPGGLLPDGDTHHLYDGHLLSEGFLDGTTLLCWDGAPVLRIPGREKLCGYLRMDGVAYSLWRDRDGNGFTLRKDGTVLLRREDGRPFGDFGDPLFGKSGALSPSGGTVCFAFTQNIGGETGGFLSVGASEILLRKGAGLQFLDIRLLEGKSWTLYRDPQGKTWLSDGGEAKDMSRSGRIRWQDARIKLQDGAPVILGTALFGEGHLSLCLCCSLSGELLSAGSGLCFPLGAETDYVLCYDAARRLILRRHMSPDNPLGGAIVWTSPENVHFASGSCASLLEERVYIGVSPREGGTSYLWAGRKLGEWTLNGYICAVEALLNPPNGGS